VHPLAEAFGGAAAAYERGRPTYPQAAVDWLVERLRIRAGATVVDLAAGTGKLTRALVGRGARIVAVEPVLGMREELARVVGGSAEILDGHAEAVPLPNGSADAVTVAQAFHWFRTDEALPEIHRVLRPGGFLALIWNSRSGEDPVNARLDAILERHGREEPVWPGGNLAWREALDLSPSFGPVEERRFPHEQVLDRDSLVDRIVSISFVAARAEGERVAIAGEVRSLAATLAEPIVLSYRTEVFVTSRP